MTREELMEKINHAESNYEVSKRRAQQLFLGYDQEKILKKLDLPHDDSFIYMTYLDREYRISRAEGVIISGTDGFQTLKEADFNETLTIMDILCYSREGVKMSGEYTLMHRLANVHNATSYAGEGMFKKDEEYFDKNPDQLKAGCEALGGIPFGKGDISYKIPVFRDLFMIVQFWFSDDEFPASLDLLSDTKTLEYMHYETVWYMACTVLERIKEAKTN